MGIIKEILNSNTFAIIVGGILTAYFSFWQYKKQKSAENINKNYFQEGIEGLILNLTIIRTTLEINYVRVLYILQKFRDLNDSDFTSWHKEFKKDKVFSFVSPEMPASLFRTNFLLDSQDLVDACIDIVVSGARLNDFFIYDIPLKITNYLKYSKKALLSKKSFSDSLNKEIREKFAENKLLYNSVDILNAILHRLNQINITSYKKIETIRDDEEVKKQLAMFKEFIPKNPI